MEKKRKALQKLELSLADMESTRERKDREFRRLQKNLMQLLLEQVSEKRKMIRDKRDICNEVEVIIIIIAVVVAAVVVVVIISHNCNCNCCCYC